MKGEELEGEEVKGEAGEGEGGGSCIMIFSFAPEEWTPDEEREQLRVFPSFFGSGRGSCEAIKSMLLNEESELYLDRPSERAAVSEALSLSLKALILSLRLKWLLEADVKLQNAIKEAFNRNDRRLVTCVPLLRFARRENEARRKETFTALCDLKPMVEKNVMDITNFAEQNKFYASQFSRCFDTDAGKTQREAASEQLNKGQKLTKRMELVAEEETILITNIKSFWMRREQRGKEVENEKDTAGEAADERDKAAESFKRKEMNNGHLGASKGEGTGVQVQACRTPTKASDLVLEMEEKNEVRKKENRKILSSCLTENENDPPSNGYANKRIRLDPSD